jgi:hypothetical protein
MNSADFRRIALSLPETKEGAHMDHPDFRVRGKIFATLFADLAWGVVMLTPEQQKAYVRSAPATFVPAKGAWGRWGSTQVLLRKVKAAALRRAIAAAWANKAPKSLSSR